MTLSVFIKEREADGKPFVVLFVHSLWLMIDVKNMMFSMHIQIEARGTASAP
jgi:hypothetical protein